jgi:erythromycin esterase
MSMEIGMSFWRSMRPIRGSGFEPPPTRRARDVYRRAALAAVVAVGGCIGNDAPAVPTDPVEWLASQAIPVASIDPGSMDFSDLQPLREVIGDARVVLLGEQSHGDGTVFLAKTRLIEFLHQEMGFDVLAFESGLFDMRKAWEAMVQGRDAREAFSTGVFGIWAGSAEVQPLIAYLGEVAHSDHPLELAGFDCKFTASGSRDSFVSDLEAFLEGQGSPLPADARWPGFRETLTGLIDGSHSTTKPPEEEKERFREVLAELRAWVGEGAAATPGSERRFWAQMLKSTEAQAERTWRRDMENLPLEWAAFRDEQMGDNLIWLANDWYRGRRIIVWAATFHNVRNLGTVDSRIPDLDYTKAVTMGHRVWQALGDDVYNLGFTAFEGEVAPWRFDSAQVLAVPTEGSLEDLMARAGLQDAIVDFRGAGPALSWLSKPMIARPLGYGEMEADWTSVLDGMFFNRVMKRSTRADSPGG